MADGKERAGSTPEPGEPDRRKVLRCALRAGLATWAAGLAAPAAVYLWPVKSEGPGNDTARAGPARALPVGKSTLVKIAGSPVLIVRTGEAEYRAFSAICTHLGCLVDWRKDQKDLFCPCHGGRFDLEGKVIGGPPPRPLPNYPVAVKDGELEVQLRRG